MAALHTIQPDVRTHVRPSAVVWIGEHQAIVARMGYEGIVSTCQIDRGAEPELAYLALVGRAIGNRERVLIMGPGSMRLALEREYVATYRRPDRLVDVEPAGVIDRERVVERLHELAA
jgi:hypothetical protein